MKVVGIGYGKNFFTPDNPERARMLACAQEVGELHMVVFSHRRDGLKRENVEDKLFLYPTNSWWSVGKLLTATRLVYRIIRKDKTDWVITAQDPFEAGLVGWFAARLTGKKLNVQEHGDFYSTDHWQKESDLNDFRYWYGKYILRWSDTVRVVSERIRRSMIKLGVAPEKILLLSVETDTAKFRDASVRPELIPDYDPNLTYLLTVARFVKQKNLEMMIKAYRRLEHEFPKTRLLVVGQGPLEDSLKKAAEKSRHVIFMPWSDDVPGLMATSNIYLLSSNYEGWGRVLVEAQAAKLPIVTTDVGCVGETVKSGSGVEVTPIGDEVAFAGAIERMLRRLPEATRAAASFVVSDSSGATYCQQWADVLRKTHQGTL